MSCRLLHEVARRCWAPALLFKLTFDGLALLKTLILWHSRLSEIIAHVALLAYQELHPEHLV